VRGSRVFPVGPLGAWRAHLGVPALVSVAFVALALAAVGCGGTRQDAHEARGEFTVQVLRASFPAHQAIAKPARLVLQVRNKSAHAVPNVAVSVSSFSYTDTAPELAASQRPVWIVDHGPGATPKPQVETDQIDGAGGATTAYVNTWALGPLAAGASRSFVWRVTPVKAGTHTVTYTVAAGLAGRAHARLAGGGAPSGHITADIAPAPPVTHVNPTTGQIAPGPLPVGP
jgi:hypothetical protein